MRAKSGAIGAIDFGSRAIRVLIAQQKGDGPIQVIGHGSAASHGCVLQGVIQDLSAAQTALKQAIEQAEHEAHEEIGRMYCGINGRNVETFIRDEKVQLDEDAVDRHHIDEAIEMASRDVMDVGKRVISSLTAQEWYVDDLGVADPIGLRGHVLKARVHFARMPSVVEDNLHQCVASQRLELEDLIFLPLATSLGCLTPEDRELGIGVLNVGRSTTGLSVHRDGRVLGTHCFDWGGYQITRDVAACLQISFEEADVLILEYGISERLIPDGDGEAAPEPAEIKLKTAVHGAPTIVSRAELDQIIYDRANELMRQVRQHLHARGLIKNLIRGVVITGGGAEIKGIGHLGEAVFQVPCRIGMPDGVEVLCAGARAPEFTAAVGIVRHGFYHLRATRNGHANARARIAAGARTIGSAVRKYFF